MQVNLEIESVTTANKKQSKNITYVNPNATNEQLKTLAQTLNALTTNSYTGAQKISESNVDSSGDQKTEPTLTVDSDGKITYNGDGTLFAKSDNSSNYVTIEDNVVRALSSSGYQVGSFTGTVYASEGTNYAAKSVQFNKQT